MTKNNNTSINAENVENAKLKTGDIRTTLEGNSSNDTSITSFDVKDAELKTGDIEEYSNIRIEIQQLLSELAEKSYTAKEVIATEIVKEEINENPSLKQRLKAALKAGGIEALTSIFQHPVVSISVETVKGFLEGS